VRQGGSTPNLGDLHESSHCAVLYSVGSRCQGAVSARSIRSHHGERQGLQLRHERSEPALDRSPHSSRSRILVTGGQSVIIAVRSLLFMGFADSSQTHPESRSHLIRFPIVIRRPSSPPESRLYCSHFLLKCSVRCGRKITSITPHQGLDSCQSPLARHDRCLHSLMIFLSRTNARIAGAWEWLFTTIDASNIRRAPSRRTICCAR